MNDVKSDTINLKLLLEKDSKEFMNLYQQLYPRLELFFRKYHLPNADITDTIQEVMISLFSNTERINKYFEPFANEKSEIPIGKITPYVFAIAKNSIYSKLKSTSKKENLVAVYSDVNEDKLEEDSLIEERSKTLNEAILKLDNKSRQIIQLRYIEGRSLDEIADILGISRASITNHIYRAMTRLKSLIKES